MPRDLFGEFVAPTVRVGSRKWYTVPASITIHVVTIGTVVVVPLIATDVFPAPPTMMMAFTAPLPSPPLPPPPPSPRPAAPERAPVIDEIPQAAPIEAPVEIAPETGFDPGKVGGVERGVSVGVPGGVLVEALKPPPPPAPLPVGGHIKPPQKIKTVNPVYPPVAQSARVQGIVILEAVIGPRGWVEDVKVLRSVPLLDEAAITAVRQWEYTPTLLNGVPVAVVMTVTVTFTLK